MVSSSSATEPNPSVRSNIRFTFTRTQQTHHTTQAFPCRLIQRRLGADNVANHVPRRHVQRSFRRHSHRQRHRTLRTETNPLRRRFLPRLHPHRLRKHVHRHRLVPGLNLPPAPQTRNKLHFSPVRYFPAATRQCRSTLPSKHFPRADAPPASMQKGSARASGPVHAPGIAEPAFIENQFNVAPLTARDAYWQDPSRNMSEFFDFSAPAMPNAPNGQPWTQVLNPQVTTGVCDETKEAGPILRGFRRRARRILF